MHKPITFFCKVCTKKEEVVGLSLGLSLSMVLQVLTQLSFYMSSSVSLDGQQPRPQGLLPRSAELESREFRGIFFSRGHAPSHSPYQAIFSIKGIDRTKSLPYKVFKTSLSSHSARPLVYNLKVLLQTMKIRFTLIAGGKDVQRVHNG